VEDLLAFHFAVGANFVILSLLLSEDIAKPFVEKVCKDDRGYVTPLKQQ